MAGKAEAQRRKVHLKTAKALGSDVRSTLPATADAAFNDEFPNRDHMIALLIKTFAIIKGLDLPVDSMWFRKSNFFTLVVEVASNIEKLPKDLPKKLLVLEENVMANRVDTNSEFYRYYSYMYQATHRRQARVVRSEFFQKYCL